jgi:hypothetical protein
LEVAKPTLEDSGFANEESFMPSAIRVARTFALVVLLIPVAAAFAGGHGHACPECGCAYCQPVPTTLKETKHCWEVECKQICIPAARWPWEKCCEPRCGKVKTVKVLKKVNYECEKCGYKWEIHGVDCACGK